MSEKRFSKTKAAGLKSSLADKDKLYLTSFGKGNKAILEKEIKGSQIKDIHTEKHFDASVISNKKFNISGRVVKDAVSDNPFSNSEIGIDRLHLKDKLEKMFFGDTFPGENIHIQIAYNILDIKKILSVYVNNVIFTINNLRRIEKVNDDKDYIGMLYTFNTYSNLIDNCSICKDKNSCEYCLAKFSKNSVTPHDKKCKSTKAYLEFMDLIEQYSCYFKEFYYTGNFKTVTGKNGKKQVDIQRNKKDTYNILRVIGCLRQFCIHDNNPLSDFLYVPVKDNEMKELVDRLYRGKVDTINKDFIKNNRRTNLPILFDIFDCRNDSQKAELTKEFYDFVICKEHKNLGFNVKTLRENMLESEELSYIRDKQYDSVRGKLFTLFDFILYKYYKDTVLQEDIIKNLRECMSEEEKDAVYKKQAQDAVENLGSVINTKLVTKMNGDDLKNQNHQKTMIDNRWIESVKISDNATDFSKIIYILTLFLDGKEINELLSSLINKLENIASFVDVLKELNIHCSFKSDYSILNNCYKISGELRKVKSFARMQKEMNKYSRGVYIDAVEILGIDKKNVNLSQEQDEEELMEEFFINNDDNNVRNFIINNLIKSNRFIYLMRYSNPKRIRKLATNICLVKFVLDGIPESQINRYFKSVTGVDADRATLEEQINELAKRISEVNFNQFVNVKQKSRNPQDNIRKEQMKAIIGLYLTVLYLVTKNIVKVNARYTIAINCFERDNAFYGINNGYQTPTALTDKFIEKGWSKDSWIDNQGKKCDMSDYKEFLLTDMFKLYRNNAAHLNVITKASSYLELNANPDVKITKIKSYYQLYHSIMQRYIMSEYVFSKGNQKAYEYVVNAVGQAKKYGSYSKDLVKVLNYPFAYNLARYKNLTNEKIFDADRG